MSLFWILAIIDVSVGLVVLLIGLLMAYNGGGKFETWGARMALFFLFWPLFLPYLAIRGLIALAQDLILFADLPKRKRKAPKRERNDF